VRGLAGFDRIFAVKCLHRARGSQVNLADPFIKTARRLAGINDPRVARVLDADVIDGLAVAVTEFVHGLDLDRFRECAQFAGVLATGSDEAADKWQKIVAYIGAEVAGGLAVMHALVPPLVHVGLSPRNIVATARGGIKILDAGLAHAANPGADPSTKRSSAYAAPAVAVSEPNPSADMRALGAILFELATGELPAQGSASAMARRALDALWPSMADFIAGLLSEDPALRPTANEAAQILADYWAEIPDASMVTEIAGLVRNFSAFVADASLQTTAPPILQEPKPEAKREPPASPPRAEVFSIAPPAPPPAAPSPPDPEPLARLAPSASFSEEVTVARPSGSYAAALFQAAPTDCDIPPFEEPPTEPIEPLLAELGPPPGRTTATAYPAVEDLRSPPADEQAPPAFEPQPLFASPPASEPVAFSESAPASPSNPIPEVADWGAQALAALGDQAGVSIASLASPPPAANALWQQAPPPPVNDPTIEEAFAFTSPPPPTDVPMPVAEATFEAEGDLSQEATEVPVAGNPLLEDELVDDAQDGGIAADPAEPIVPEAEFALTSPPAQATEEPALPSATAFEEEEVVQAEWAPPRLAHAMPAPQEDDGRHPADRRAAGSSLDSAADDMFEILAGSGRKKRIAVGIVVFALVGGSLAGALTALGVFGERHRPPVSKKLAEPAGKTSEPARSPHAPAKPAGPVAQPAPVARPAVQVASASSPTAKAALPSRAAKTEGKPSASPAAAGKPMVAEKPVASGSATIAVSVTSKPAGAAVWIDGQERGTTPCTVKLARGTARLTLIRAGYLSHTSTFDIGEGKTVDTTLQAVAPPLEGDARFRAECKTVGKLPIVVDGRETGILCPYSRLRVDPGPHSIGVLVPATGKVHAKEITLSAGVRSVVFGD
jgi:serine/threonine protein kinase